MSTTTPTGIIIDNTPQALRGLRQFVGWRYEQRDGKATKVPCDARSGAHASADDPETWCSFDAAVAGYQCDRFRLDGIGIVFTKNDGLFGFDLDDCRNPETGEIHTDAQRIIDAMATYCEVSPSGTGVKGIGRGSKPGERCRTSKTEWAGEIEIYDAGRYFTLTGWRLDDAPDDVQDAQDALQRVYDHYFAEASRNGEARSAPCTDGFTGDDAALVQKMLSARNGASVEALWNGDATGYGSASEADLALCSAIAFYAGDDPARIDRIFRGSGLMREKWERADYRDKTIGKSLERDEFYSGRTKRKAANHDAPSDPAPIEGPAGLVLLPSDAGYRGSQVWATYTVVISGEEVAPITISTSTTAKRDACREIKSWMAAQRGAEKLPKKEAAAVEQFVNKTLQNADKLAEHFKAQRQAQPREAPEGPTMQGIIISEAPRLAGLAFKEDDGRIWSEPEGRPIDAREFEKRVPSALVEACEQAVDYPEDRVGMSAPVGMIRQYLLMAWTEALKGLPGEVRADTGPDSEAARRYAAAIVRLFSIRERWRKTYGRDNAEVSMDSATLAQLAREKLTHQNPVEPTGWIRCHNAAIDAWCCHVPVLGDDGEPTGEPPHRWLAMRYELVHQLPKHSRPDLPNTASQYDLARLANRYGLTAEGAECAPTQYVREGASAFKVMVLNAQLCRQILDYHEADDDPEEINRCADAQR